VSNLANNIDSVWDVVIIGAGPAGSATAITLASLGQRVILIDEQVVAKYKLGESLPPASVDIVGHFLGEFESQDSKAFGLYKTAGNVSTWSSEQLDHADFFFTATGFGLCIDRLAFDEALRLRALEFGASLRRGVSFESCTRSSEPGFNWNITLSSPSKVEHHRARYLVDCSGRRAVVSRMLDIPIAENEDRLFAYAQWFASGIEDDDRFTRIEAVANGWWYSNRVPTNDNKENKRLVVFYSDRDLPDGKRAGNSVGFDELLSGTTQIAPLLKASAYKASGVIRGAPANSQRLREFCGDAWMAVGDAAQAYDPLSSQGIDKALRTGSHAGHLIHYALMDETDNSLGADNHFIQQYSQQQQQLWDTYLSQRRYYYSIQTRWSEQSFWRRRQNYSHVI
jgi:flavin-dependent dehydrogenase